MTANFAINQYTLGVTSSGNGSVAKAPNQALYNHGTQVTLTGTPAVGYHFLNWSGDTTATTNPLIFNITGNKAIVGNFEINQYTLNLHVDGRGDRGEEPETRRRTRTAPWCSSPARPMPATASRPGPATRADRRTRST